LRQAQITNLKIACLRDPTDKEKEFNLKLKEINGIIQPKRNQRHHPTDQCLLCCNRFAFLLSYNIPKPRLVAMQIIMAIDTFWQTRQ
jgi:hypothetical protein